MSHDLRTTATAMSRSALPNEVCGLVVGPKLAQWGMDSTVHVTGFVRVRNAAGSPTRFELAAQSMLDAEGRILAAGDEVIGVIHSHPVSPAVPSTTDVSDARIYDPASIWLQLIVSMQGFAPNIRAWRFPRAADDSGAVPTELGIHLVDGELRSP